MRFLPRVHRLPRLVSAAHLRQIKSWFGVPQRGVLTPEIHRAALTPDVLERRICETAPRQLLALRLGPSTPEGQRVARWNMAGVDIFRFDDDAKIVEHWDVLQQVPETTASGNDMFSQLS